jgi:hypothetical protein
MTTYFVNEMKSTGRVGKRFFVPADEKLTAFVELESASAVARVYVADFGALARRNVDLLTRIT